MIKYLIKFVSQLNHAEMLINGELFMRPASYYRNLEEGQGDIREGLVFHGLRMYKNGEFPICCFYSVNDAEIQDGYFLIPNKCITDFKCETGYAVIIDFDEFLKIIPTLQCDGYSVWYDSISYGIPSKELSAKILLSNDLTNLFIKNQSFAYQKEFRIAVAKAVYGYDTPLEKRKESIIYRFANDLGRIAKILQISKLSQVNGNYVVDIINLDLLSFKNSSYRGD